MLQQQRRRRLIEFHCEDRKEAFNTTIKAIIPLPDFSADPSDPSHPSKYPDIPVGTRVQAIYPDTSSFYLGVVHKSAVKKGKYFIIFDDDDNIPKDVSYDMVWEVSCMDSSPEDEADEDCFGR